MRDGPPLARIAACLLPWLAVACAPAAPAPGAPATPRPTAGSVAAPAAAPTASAAAESAALPASPTVELKVFAQPLASFAPHFIAHERGYFREVGITVDWVTNITLFEELPAIARGQIHVGYCSSAFACLNAFERLSEVQLVAGLQSAGKTPKSSGNLALVARKDLYDAGTLRQPADLVGRTIHFVVDGVGGQPQAALWLQRHGVNPASVEWAGGMGFPEQLLAMQNGIIEAGYQTEPLLSAGLARGAHQPLATIEDMDPAAQVLYLMYWAGIDQLGPRVGERFMVAFLRGVRDYINAFEYDIDQDAIIDILTRETAIKDPAVYRQIKYSYVDPNGVLLRDSLQRYAALFRELGLTSSTSDLSRLFEDRYRQAAVRHLGEYQPPR